MWEISNYNQIVTFALSLCLGAICCAIYDVVRALRRVCLNSIFAITAIDIILWIFFAFITFVFLIARTNGEVRGFVIFGEFIGFVVFRISVSKIIFRILSFIFIKAFAFKRKINRFLYKFYSKIELLTLNFFKCIKKLLKRVGKLLYTYKNNLSMEKNLNETKTEA